MGLHCSIGELQCIQYFKSVFLEILNVHIRSVFVDSVTYRQNIIRGAVPKRILFTKKENLKEFIEECLHKRECEWDLVAVGDIVK